MLYKKYRSALKESLKKNRLYVWMLILMLIANILLAFKIIAIDLDEKIIIHPLSATTSYWIKDNKVDPYYLEAYAKEFIQGRFMYNPKTVHAQFDSLIKHFHPSIYGNKKNELAVTADLIKRKEESSVFFPMSVHVKQDDVYVTGEITGFIGKKHVSTKEKTFEIDFRQSNGRVWIYDWQEVVLDSKGKRYVPVESNT